MTELEIPETTVRGTRKAPEITAWVLWAMAFLTVMVGSTMSINATQLTLDERNIAALQFALIGWVIVAPSAYFWRRGGGYSHLDGLIWLLVVLTIPSLILYFASSPVFWHAVLAPIPFSAIF